MFSDCIIAFAGFDRSNFTGAEFEACNAIGASFVECNFTRGYLMDSAFGEADFFGAVFAGSRLTANFREAYFARSRWTDALSIGSRFDEAIFGFTVMHKSMIVACSFPGVRVIAPCDIDASTVSVSITANSVAIAPLNNKNDPDSHSARVELLETLQSTQRFFLLAGVERNLVQSYLRGMASLSRNYETAFISYSSEDEELAEKLWRRLQTAGIDTWFAPHNMQGGRTILEQISDAIDGQSKMILVLSVSSIRSNWVATEVRRAVNVERETGSKRLCNWSGRRVGVSESRVARVGRW
jgi:hypothetical protein